MVFAPAHALRRVGNCRCVNRVLQQVVERMRQLRRACGLSYCGALCSQRFNCKFSFLFTQPAALLNGSQPAVQSTAARMPLKWIGDCQCPRLDC